MKRRYSMIKKCFVKSTLGFTLAGLLLGCSNLFTNAGEANSTYTKNNDEKVNCVITGSISTGAAMPSSLVPGLNNGNGEARSAFASLPNFTDDDISIEITATGISSAGSTLEPVNGTATASTSSYAISISDAGTWTITAKMFKGTGENKKLIMQKIINGIKINATNYRVNKNIELEVVESNDDGSIKLEIVDETTARKINKVLWQDKSGKIANSYQIGVNFSDGKAIIDETGVASGSYSLYLEFENIVGNNHSTIFKVNNEAINVFANLTTDTWVKNGDEIYLQDNGDGTAKFVITDECLRAYALTDIYVNPNTGNDINRGTPVSPVKTLSKAVTLVNASPNEGPFTIHLSEGTHEVTNGDYLCPEKALTICGQSREKTIISDCLDQGYYFFAFGNGIPSNSVVKFQDLTYNNKRNKQQKHIFTNGSSNPVEFRFDNVKFTTVDYITMNTSDNGYSMINIKDKDSLYIHDCLFSHVWLRYPCIPDCQGAIINAPGDSMYDNTKTISNVTIENTVFENCKVDVIEPSCKIEGGFIYTSVSTKLKNVKFVKDTNNNENEVSSQGDITGGIICSNGQSFVCEDCIFADCKINTDADKLIAAAVYYDCTVHHEYRKTPEYVNCKTYNITTSGTTNVKGVGLNNSSESSGDDFLFSGTTWFDDNSTIYLGEGFDSSGNPFYCNIHIKSDLTPQNQYNQSVSYVATIAPKDNDYNYTIGKKILHETQQSSTTYQYTLVPANYQKFKLLSAPGSDCDYKLVVDSNVAKVVSALSTPSSLTNSSQNLATWLENSNNTKIGVETEADFKALADLSNQSFEGKTIKLVNDITLDAGSGSFGSNDVKFKGTIDGNNKTITFSNGKELITKAAGCTIKNLNTAGTMSGNGLISEAGPDSEIMTFDNCHNKVEINSTANCTGSFIGMYNQGSSKVSFTNCTNEGNIVGLGKAGGFIGSISAKSGNRVSVTIKNCSNKGDVSGNNQGCGGFVGNVTAFVELNIDRCHNEKKVQGPYAGGIIGWVAEECSSVTVTNCYNAGESVQGTSVTGGIIGFISISTTTIRNCYNSGKIIKSSGSAGGIVGGYNGNLSIKFTNCVNYGEFSDAANSGGCFGSNYISPTYTNCYSYYPEENYEGYPEKVIYNKINTGTVQNYKIIIDNKPIINDGSDTDLILTLNNNIVEGDCEWKINPTTDQPYFELD